MHVVRGKEIAELDASQVSALLDGYDHVVVDVGTGDGRFAYTYAREHPDTFVLGFDVVKENLRETSRRAARKPAKGGVANVAYAWASAEEPPEELTGRADEIYVILPWGRLLDGLALGDAAVLDGLTSIAAPGALLRVTLNCEVWGANVPVKVRHLPELTPEYVRETLSPRYRERRVFLHEARLLGREEVRDVRSPWAKRVRSSRDWPRFLYLEAAVHEDRRGRGER